MLKYIAGIIMFFVCFWVTYAEINLNNRPVCPAPYTATWCYDDPNYNSNTPTWPLPEQDFDHIVITKDLLKSWFDKEKWKAFNPEMQELNNIWDVLYKYVNNKGELIYFTRDYYCNVYNWTCKNTGYFFHDNYNEVIESNEYIIFKMLNGLKIYSKKYDKILNISIKHPIKTLDWDSFTRIDRNIYWYFDVKDNTLLFNIIYEWNKFIWKFKINLDKLKPQDFDNNWLYFYALELKDNVKKDSSYYSYLFNNYNREDFNLKWYYTTKNSDFYTKRLVEKEIDPINWIPWIEYEFSDEWKEINLIKTYKEWRVDIKDYGFWYFRKNFIYYIWEDSKIHYYVRKWTGSFIYNLDLSILDKILTNHYQISFRTDSAWINSFTYYWERSILSDSWFTTIWFSNLDDLENKDNINNTWHSYYLWSVRYNWKDVWIWAWQDVKDLKNFYLKSIRNNFFIWKYWTWIHFFYIWTDRILRVSKKPLINLSKSQQNWSLIFDEIFFKWLDDWSTENPDWTYIDNDKEWNKTWAKDIDWLVEKFKTYVNFDKFKEVFDFFFVPFPEEKEKYWFDASGISFWAREIWFKKLHVELPKLNKFDNLIQNNIRDPNDNWVWRKFISFFLAILYILIRLVLVLFFFIPFFLFYFISSKLAAWIFGWDWNMWKSQTTFSKVIAFVYIWTLISSFWAVFLSLLIFIPMFNVWFDFLNSIFWYLLTNFFDYNFFRIFVNWFFQILSVAIPVHIIYTFYKNN